MKEVTVEVDDDLYNYLEFLERTRYIKNKSQAIHKALLLFRRLSMHDWLPDIYRIGENRVIVMDRGMLLDLFESLSDGHRDAGKGSGPGGLHDRRQSHGRLGPPGAHCSREEPINLNFLYIFL